MLAQEIIIKKRDGLALSPDEINAIISGLTDGTVSDAQAGAFAMAVLLKGMDDAERVALTRAMQHSGDVLNWDLPGPVVDKHSTGGVGDNVSLMLAPALAACGAYVPMISGRGLGHTGGTLDKFDSIPGYISQPDEALFRKVVQEVGCAIVGQTADIAPADKRLYAVRDVTGTVESIDLICASILSKKLAAGLSSLVLDVKFGSGAFMSAQEDARDLARTLVDVANQAGCKTSALLTDMNEPLASAAGNALEMINAVQLLTGEEVDGRLWDITTALGAEILTTCGLVASHEAGTQKIADALQSGRAAQKFGEMVAMLGGPNDFVEHYRDYLPKAPVMREVTAPSNGFVSRIDTRDIGMAVVELGGGRKVATDEIDYSVGLDWILGQGLLADETTPLCRIHAQSETDADAAASRILAAYHFSETPPEPSALIVETVN